MKDFFLNFTRIIETNPKIYWSIIVGIAACLGLFIVEAVHIQNIIVDLNTHDQRVLKQAIEPLAQRYTWSRVIVVVIAILSAHYQFVKTKKKLGLTRSK